MISRRDFLQFVAGLGTLAAAGPLAGPRAASAQDYKALVCVFLHGGNDGHNLVVPLDSAQYAAYQRARGALALPTGQLLPIQDAVQGMFGLPAVTSELATLFTQGKLAVVANVGILAEPTSYDDLADGTARLPSNLRSHAVQRVSMQTGCAISGTATGWGGRLLDQLETYNSGASRPVSISMCRLSLYCSGVTTEEIVLQPGSKLEQQGLGLATSVAGKARLDAQQAILAGNSGNAMVDAANDVLAEANALNAAFATDGPGPAFPKPFPGSDLGTQLKDIARMISLNAQYGVGRQVFLCSLDGFDTHITQVSRQSTVLQQVSKALDAFSAAMTFIGLDRQVTLFTLSDFGRTLTPSGNGTDHGWGNHHLVLGGAVNGGKIYGRFPLMTNFAALNASADDFADPRGVMLPSISLAEYGATLARWFGASEAQIDGILPDLLAFSSRDLGFFA
jgi:uncharacterized protein (DUF1501 family)